MSSLSRMITPSFRKRAGPPGALVSQLYSMTSGYFPDAVRRLNCSVSWLSGGCWKSRWIPVRFSISLYMAISPNVFIVALTFELIGHQYVSVSGELTIGRVSGSAVAPAAVLAVAVGPPVLGAHAASAVAPAPAPISFRNSRRSMGRAMSCPPAREASRRLGWLQAHLRPVGPGTSMLPTMYARVRS